MLHFSPRARPLRLPGCECPGKSARDSDEFRVRLFQVEPCQTLTFDCFKFYQGTPPGRRARAPGAWPRQSQLIIMMICATVPSSSGIRRRVLNYTGSDPLSSRLRRRFKLSFKFILSQSPPAGRRSS